MDDLVIIRLNNAFARHLVQMSPFNLNVETEQLNHDERHHGSILENSSGTYYEGGLAKVGGKLKEFKAADPDHTFIISSGDMWQGSMESNLNEGALITEAMNNIGFDSMTLGNHAIAVRGRNRLAVFIVVFQPFGIDGETFPFLGVDNFVAFGVTA